MFVINVFNIQAIMEVSLNKLPVRIEDFGKIKIQEFYYVDKSESALETVRKWYDVYHFGSSDIYCPWYVIKYCQALIKNKQAFPQNYWANTSGNALIRRFIDNSTVLTKKESNNCGWKKI